VSLILDALKKLERDKDAREPGVLVVGSVPWGARTRSRRPLVLALAGIGLVALLAFALWPRDRAARPTPGPPPSTPFASPASARTPPTTPTPRSATSSPTSAVPPEARRLSVPSSSGAAAEAPPAGLDRAQDDTPTSPPPPAAAGGSGTAELRLNAISQRDGRPLALINDRLVFEGDSFDGVKIVRIGESEVEVEVRGKRRVLRF
jgi:hypothetical protein